MAHLFSLSLRSTQVQFLDSPATTYDWGSIPGDFMTANFKFGGKGHMDKLLQLQPERPILIR